MQQTCRNCQATFEITNEDLAFYDKVSPVFNGQKESIPPPTNCPDCRLQRRLAFRNQIYVYTHPSSTTGKPIFSMFPPGAPFPVVDRDEWFSDTTDGTTVGRDYSFDKPFFEQFLELRSVAPHYARSIGQCQNSDYCNNASDLKNCYMVFNTDYAQDDMYCEMSNGSKDCLDSTLIVDSELCYDCTWCFGCYNLQSSITCNNCSDSFFLRQCRSCKNCFGCINLRQQEYCIFNQKKTKQEYEEWMQGFHGSSASARAAILLQVQEFFLQHPVPHMVATQTEDVSGNYLQECRDTQDSYFCSRGESLRHCYAAHMCKDSSDYSLWGMHAEQMYEAMSCGTNAFHHLFCGECWEATSEMLYCQYCVGCNNCFGCVGLHKKKYCIFNKQYSKEEYDMLVPKIIEHMRQTGEWGEFFPLEAAPVPYNISIAQRHFPLTPETAASQGLRWYESVIPEAAQAIDPSALPDDLPQTDDAIIVKSSLSGRPFKITSEEIKRYRRHSVPLPRMTYDERMEQRHKQLGDLRLYDRTCMKTGKPIKTTISPDEPWIVWDKDVYDQEFGS